MSRKIQDGNFKYFFLKIFVDMMLKRSYRKFQIEGSENIPKNSSVIWATNHTNALMDALVILSLTKGQKVFVARADIFKKPFVIKLLTFFKLMPIYRIRDGIESVKHNDEVIAHAVDILSDGVPLSIFPEATHRAMHSLLRLSKGVFHITTSVYEKSGDDRPVYILPIGIDYGDYFRYRSTVLIRFGEPINVTKFMNEHKDFAQPILMQMLRDILTAKMSSLIAYVPDDEDYDAVWEYAKIHADNKSYFNAAIKKIEEKSGKLKGLMRIQAVNKYAIEEALEFKKNNGERASELFQQIDARRLWRIQNGVSAYSIASDNILNDYLCKTMLVLLGLPYFVFSLITTITIWLPTFFILRMIKDDAFYNSARFMVRLILSFFSFSSWTIFFFCLLPPFIAIPLTVLLIPAYSYLNDFNELLRRWASDLRWMINRKKAPQVE